MKSPGGFGRQPNVPMREAPVGGNRSGAEGDNYDSDILRWNLLINLTGYALRWAQRDWGDSDFPPSPSGLPFPLETARVLTALDPGLYSEYSLSVR